MAVFAVHEVNSNDEVERYQMGRYISSNETVWRILSFSIHNRDPFVHHLAIHLENGQRVYFTEENAALWAMTPPKTTLTEFFQLYSLQNSIGTFARTLLYSEVPNFFTWNKNNKTWEPRKRGKPVAEFPGIFKTNALSRLYTVHPNQRERFYLKLLLINIRGPSFFDHLRTVNGQLYSTYHNACRALNLLEDDAHWDYTLQDATLTSTPYQIRALFAIILTTCFLSNPSDLWEKYKNAVSEDILHLYRTITGNPNIDFSEDIYNEALIKLEDLCMNISNEPLIKLGMPPPNQSAIKMCNASNHIIKPICMNM